MGDEPRPGGMDKDHRRAAYAQSDAQAAERPSLAPLAAYLRKSTQSASTSSDGLSHDRVWDALRLCFREFLGSDAVFKQESTLFEVGVDSFGAIQIAQRLEQLLGLNFEEADLEALGKISLGDIAAYLSQKCSSLPHTDQSKTSAPVSLVARGLQLRAHLPEIARSDGNIVLAIGSSPILQNFDALSFDEELGQISGERFVSYNLGFPLADNLTLLYLATQLKSVFQAMPRRAKLAILDFGMPVSTRPADESPAPSFRQAFESSSAPVPDGDWSNTPLDVMASFLWDMRFRGSKPFDLLVRAPRPMIDAQIGERARFMNASVERRIKLVQGEIAFQQEQVDAFISTVELLKEFCDHTVVFISPFSPQLQTHESPTNGNEVAIVLDKIQTRTGIAASQLFAAKMKLTASDFMDDFHLSPLGAAQMASRWQARFVAPIICGRESQRTHGASTNAS